VQKCLKTLLQIKCKKELSALLGNNRAVLAYKRVDLKKIRESQMFTKKE
jgi:hypothetical protein